jgi:hypothetical protein
MRHVLWIGSPVLCKCVPRNISPRGRRPYIAHGCDSSFAIPIWWSTHRKSRKRQRPCMYSRQLDFGWTWTERRTCRSRLAAVDCMQTCSSYAATVSPPTGQTGAAAAARGAVFENAAAFGIDGRCSLSRLIFSLAHSPLLQPDIASQAVQYTHLT